jgi:hypothetical protein
MQQDQLTESDRPVVETVTEARQGVTGHNVRRVLGYGLAGAVIVVLGTALLFIFAH